MIEQAPVSRTPAALHSLFARVPDRRLVKLAAGGSAPAFATIYRRHHAELYRYCRSLLGNDDDAGDALQNTMLRALRGLDGERREIALRPWLFRIAHNESISLIRSRGEVSPLAPEEVTATSGTYDLEARERFDALMSDIGQLSSHQRSALVMRELSGLEFSEIAAALQTSPEAAKQAVYQARVALGELAEGRDLKCDEVRRKLSADDRRRLRGRRVRAHLTGCSECRDFQRQMRDRSRTLAGFAPTLSMPAGSLVLEGVLGAGAGGAGGAGGGIAGLLGAAAGAKATATVAAVVAISAGVYATERGRDAKPAGGNSPAAGAAERHGPIERAPVDGSSAAAASDAAPGSELRAPDAASDGGERSGGGGQPGGGSTDAVGGSSAADTAPGSQISPAGPDGSGGHGGPSSAPQAPPPGQGMAPPAQSNPAPSPASPQPAPPGTPPGHGGIPPGLGGTPPGQIGSSAGQTGLTPGHSGAAPGHGGTPPGHGGSPPGQILASS